MKSFGKKLMTTIFVIILVIVLFLLVFYLDKFDIIRLRPVTLVEQIPYGEVIEIGEFEETEFYDSMNKFIGADIVIRVRFAAHIEPAERLPTEYKNELKKAYSNVDIYVKEIPSKEALEKMMEALADSKYLKFIEDKEIQAFLYETKINNKKVKRIEKIFLTPDSYFFVKY
ncbi:MAG: hypothetical protein GTN73_09320 [Candidatus Aminicenantes bacterium]|nr:hypothetical protein [Candidatus Aminicenantes bacterium]